MKTKDEVMSDVVWVAHTLFKRGMSRGATGNISFKYDNQVFISKSGTCFGKINHNSFSILNEDLRVISGNPSKEYPLHMILYKANPNNRFVLHTHSFYVTLISCLANPEKAINEMMKTTPYLNMLTKRKVRCVDYQPPGSSDLFKVFDSVVIEDVNVYLLKNHGIIISGNSIEQAFNILEEFEESAKLYYHLQLLEKI